MAKYSYEFKRKIVMEYLNGQDGCRYLGKKYGVPHSVNDDCNYCGICAKVCPANNISVTKDGIRFSDHCEVCYACLHNCPQHAIHLPKEAGKVQFRNEHVTVADIIRSNE